MSHTVGFIGLGLMGREILEGIGHTPHWEDPTRFVAHLLRFLESRSP
jgi:pimeloyl-ACP methyl ester carboxylesterase